jgi:hypothetical protein
MKNSYRINFVILFSLLLILAISLPRDVYYGIKVVALIYLLSSIILYVFLKVIAIFISAKKNVDDFSPVFIISNIFGVIITGVVLHSNSLLITRDQVEIYIPEYEVSVKTSDCYVGSKKSRRRAVLRSNTCLIDIEKIDYVIGAILQEYSIRDSEVNCIRFDIFTGTLGLKYAANVISCSDIKNKLRVRAYNKSIEG